MGRPQSVITTTKMAAPIRISRLLMVSHRVSRLPRSPGVVHGRLASHRGSVEALHHSTLARNSESPSDVLKHFDWISESAPCFPVSGDKITVLNGPVEYFETLKERLHMSRQRVVLAALYLGTGWQEEEIVNALYESCQKGHLTNPSSPLDVRILLDCTRGSRGRHNSRTMLLPLLRDFPGDVQVSLYHTPDLRGILKRLIPERWNEVIGLSHLKVCIFDDTVIISGANLSESYFTNRQDRYVMLEDCPRVADFFSELVSAVSSFSFQLNADDTLTLDPEVNIHPFQGDEKTFKETARNRIQRILDPSRWSQSSKHPTKQRHSHQHQGLKCNHSDAKQTQPRNSENLTSTESLQRIHGDATCSADDKTTSNSLTNDHTLKMNTEMFPDTKSEMSGQSEKRNPMGSQDCSLHRTSEMEDTLVFPLVQMGPFGVCIDQQVTGHILRSGEEGSCCVLASGYFNLTKEYMDIVLSSKALYNILMASPQANGFYGAKGISGYVPAAYNFIARNFLRKVQRQSQGQRILMYEYYRQGWTFHVKGLWYYLREQSLPSMTLIGSPNFGHRSVHRDLEAQVAIVTSNEKLQNQLYEEQQRFFSQSQPVTDATFKQDDHQVPLWAKIFTFVTRNFF